MFDDPTFQALYAAFHEAPFSRSCAGVLADWCEENGGDLGQTWAGILREKRVPLTTFETLAAEALGRCSFAPRTFDKRFGRSIADSVIDASVVRRWVPSLTVKQYLWMWILLRRYRRTVPKGEIVKEATRRYDKCIELLGIEHLKPLNRRLTVKNKAMRYMQPTIFDEQE